MSSRLRHLKLIGIAGLFMLLGGNSITAQTKHRVTLNDLLSIKDIHAAEISPDDKHIAWISNREVHISEIGKPGSSVQLIGSGSAPVWSPDGRKLAYYSTKSGTDQLWVYDLSSRSSKKVTDIAGGINPEIAAPPSWFDDYERYSWSPDGTQIVFASQVPVTAPMNDEKESEDTNSGKPLILSNTTPAAWTLNGVFVSAFGQPTLAPGTQHPKIAPTLTSQIFITNIQAAQSRQITHDDQGYFTPDWSPDGKSIACSTPSGHNTFGFFIDTTSIVEINLETGKNRSLTNAIGNKAFPTWSPDGRKLAFFTGVASGERQSVDVLDVKSGDVQNVSRQLPVSIGEFRWLPDSRAILGLAMDGVDWRLVRMELGNGAVHSPGQAGAAQRVHVSVAEDGDMAWVESNGTHAGLLQLMRPGADHAMTLINLNPQIDDWELGHQEVVHWRGGRGEDMEGILIKPVGYQKGKRYPLIVNTYPGIRNSFNAYTMQGDQAWASKGYAVFYPDASAPHVWMNPFRSPKFDESAKGPDGFEVTAEQVLSGVDELVKGGIVDADRMGLYGFSNGGGITNALLSRTNRFKCAVSVAAVYPDWFAPFFLHTDSPLPKFAASGDPIQNPENYIKLSSVFRAEKVETPVLIADGDLDQDFLIGSIEWFNALRWSKKKVTFLRYPGQGHGFGGAAMQDFWVRESAFFDLYLHPGQSSNHGNRLPRH